MEIKEQKKAAKKAIRKRHGLRFAVWLNFIISVLLAFCAVVLVNYISSKYHTNIDISRSDFYKLSPKTKVLISGLQDDVHIILFIRKNNIVFEDTKNLIREFVNEAERAGNKHLKVTVVDPDRDLADVRALKQKYGLDKIDTVLVECRGRTKYIEADSMVDHQVEITAAGRPVDHIVGYRGEEMIASAIENVVYEKRPTVYFLSGHGEHRLDDTTKQKGLSQIGYKVVHDNINVYSLVLTKKDGIPDDCSALVIVGPTKKFSAVELDMLSDYLDNGGRLMVLLDSQTETGLEALLEKWNVKLGNDVVGGLTLTGHETLIINYGKHPITEKFNNVTTMFYLPRSVEPLNADDKSGGVDRPRVTVLAKTGKEGWADKSINQRPLKYDRGVDRPGPVSVAVAVERGSVGGLDLKIKTTRMVVFGDSYFISNAALDNGIGGNVDMFMSSLNWLLDRSSHLNIGPKIPGELRLEMSSAQLRNAYLIIALGIPAVFALVGLVIIFIRRR